MIHYLEIIYIILNIENIKNIYSKLQRKFVTLLKIKKEYGK